jgi:ssDNA-binding Zn-finger/Zn-ribbon topoisomerase 1
MEQKNIKKCPNCLVEMQSYVWQQPLILLRGTIPPERTLPLEVFACPKCDRIDLYALDETRKVLESGKVKPEARLCPVCRHEAPLYGKCPQCGAEPKDNRTPMF